MKALGGVRVVVLLVCNDWRGPVIQKGRVCERQAGQYRQVVSVESKSDYFLTTLDVLLMAGVLIAWAALNAPSLRLLINSQSIPRPMASQLPVECKRKKVR
jgi:hypothetical protein